MLHKEIKVHSRKIGKNHKPFIVAEIGLNHNNDLEVGKRTIQKAKEAGADAVKFQSYITDEFIDKTNPEAKFLYDIFKTYELSEKFHREFQKAAEEEGLVFFSTPLCLSSVDLLSDLDVPILKIASGDITNKALLEKCNQTGLAIFLSTGAADFYEVTRAVEYLKSLNQQELALFHCVSLYPTPPKNLNLKTIKLYEDIYDFPIGFSDHSAGFLGAAIAVSYNACIIEKHFTLDKNLDGPDHGISADYDELKSLVENCMLAFEMKGEKEKIVHENELGGRFFGRRSLYKQNGQAIALRPAKHLREEGVLDSWQIELGGQGLPSTNEWEVIKLKS